MLGLGDLPGGSFNSIANAASADGSKVTGFSYSGAASRPQAFAWSPEAGMVGLGFPPGVTSFEHSEANAISSDGSVVVGRAVTPSFVFEAFRQTSSGAMVGLGDLPGAIFESEARGVSSDGSVIVGRGAGAAGWEAFRWTEGTGMVGIGDLAGGFFDSAANAVSRDGSVVVGQGRSAFGPEAFRWTAEGGMVGLGDLAPPRGTRFSVANAVSGDGSVIVGSSSAALGAEAFIWTPTGGMRELDVFLAALGVDLAGWNLYAATGVSADGTTIVGNGINPSGQQEAWIAIIPEPSTSLLMGIGLAGLSCRRSGARSVVRLRQ